MNLIYVSRREIQSIFLVWKLKNLITISSL